MDDIKSEMVLDKDRIVDVYHPKHVRFLGGPMKVWGGGAGYGG